MARHTNRFRVGSLDQLIGVGVGLGLGLAARAGLWDGAGVAGETGGVWFCE